MPELLWTGRAGKKLTNHTRAYLRAPLEMLDQAASLRLP